ncbi:TlpA disulfide reductase family protein [Magnetovibrio sp. PR-2]|uniref:TlpA family protein disulfide reductase n=1 Tax=Magnetovibrio sp. PR-2 TaxID=3120356 RepID=UPI002FCE102A
MMRLPTLFVIASLISFAVGGVGYYLAMPNLGKDYAKPVDGDISFVKAADQLEGFSLLTNMPPIPGVDMLDEAGNTVTFDKFKGKVVVFNLWATWCPPCIREMPDLNSLQVEFKDQDFIVVPVASGKQGTEEPAEFLRKRNLDALTTYYDPGSEFLRMFDIETLPTTFVLDKNGNMRGGVIGMTDWYSDEAKAMLRALLAEG